MTILRNVLALCVATTLFGCDRPAPPATDSTKGALAASSSTPAVREAAQQPPFETFELKPWKSPLRDVQPVQPPATLLEPWRVFVNQLRPRQKKNPKWRSLPAKEAAELDMAADGSFRCLVTPLAVEAQTSEDMDRVEAWVLTRRLRCSADGWKTWTEHPHQMLVLPDGTEQRPVDRTSALLRERIDGRVRETLVTLRSDEDKNTTRTGPPQVIDAPQHVD